MVEKVFAASRSGSGYPWKPSLAWQARRSLKKGGGNVEAILTRGNFPTLFVEDVLTLFTQRVYFLST